MRRENSIASPRLRPSWCVSRLISSLQLARQLPVPQESNHHDSHCHDGRIPILLARVRRQPCATRRKHYRIVNLAPELGGKRLELLKEIVPKLSRVAVLWTSTYPGNAQVRRCELAARRLE